MGWEMTRTMKQERAARRLQEWEANDRRARAADEAAKRWLEDPKSARELLLDPELFPKLVADIAKAGLVGEKGNALATYIVATSRIREKPLNEIVKGKSSGGKNFLAKTVL
jgi:hypothetical protein